MINITNPADCCGCTACASICAHNAITMQPDSLGFLYQVVDTAKCVNCGLCEKVCAFNDNYDTSQNFSEPIAYGARQKDINEVMQSRSGAVFAALSDYILENGGVIYGAGYTDHFRVVHKRTTTKEERDELRGSKYVQSDMRDIFRSVKADLQSGKVVLFSGTPCQTSGLNSFISRKLRNNLFLVDIVCHGVPSPYIWRDYIAYLEKKQGSKIVWVNFRDKEQFGWASHHETFKFEGGGVKMWFTKVFYQHIMFRHSCGNCHFCNTRRPSDITIADFWGHEKQDPAFNADNKGVNLVLINTEKGNKLFEAVRNRLDVINAEKQNYLQPNLIHPSKVHRKRLQFQQDYEKHGFEYVYNKKYSDVPLYRHGLSLIKRIIKKIIRYHK